MKTTLSTFQAVNILLNDEYANWSYNGAYALIEFLEEQEVDLGEEHDLDPVALRCDFSEYQSAKEAMADIKGQWFGETDDEEQEALDALDYETLVIPFDGGVIVRNF